MNSKIDFFDNGLATHCGMVSMELEAFIEFHSEAENNWDRNCQNIEKHMRVTLSQNPEEAREQITEHYVWDLHKNQSLFPNIHRTSLLLTIFNYHEDKLNELCNIFSESIDSQVRLKDLKGNGVERASSYLKKVVGIDFSSMGEEKPYIAGINQVRNQIVHNGSRLPEDHYHKVNKFISITEGISGEPGCEIALSKQFIDNTIEMLIKFYDKIGIAVQGYIKGQNN